MFLWAYVKHFLRGCNRADELKQPITVATERGAPAMLKCVWAEGSYWLDICRATKGAKVEIY
jgi:hypothetical protein